MKKIEGTENQPLQNTLIACIQGCMKFLGNNVSIGWLYGATGYALIMNIHEVLDPSGPTAWIWGKKWLSAIAANIGCRIDGIFALKSDKDFAEKQKMAWEHIRRALDNNKPCFGWQIGNIPDFFLIDGYDDTGYYSRYAYPNYDYDNTDYISRYKNPTPYPIEQGPIPWQKIGTYDVELLAVYSVQLAEPKDNKNTIREAVRFALDFAEGKYLPLPEITENSQYRTGLGAYDNWIAALEAGKAQECGTTYNIDFWLECRRFAVDFFEAAKMRLGNEYNSYFMETINYYQEIFKHFSKLDEMFPSIKEWSTKPIKRTDERIPVAVQHLKAAREAEMKALNILARIENEL